MFNDSSLTSNLIFSVTFLSLPLSVELENNWVTLGNYFVKSFLLRRDTRKFRKRTSWNYPSLHVGPSWIVKMLT